MKRVRGNGGSRSSLRPEGIVIIGQYDSHRRIAQALAVPVPGRGSLSASGWRIDGRITPGSRS
jgi:Restriction endonuclease NaeI